MSVLLTDRRMVNIVSGQPDALLANPISVCVWLLRCLSVCLSVAIVR